MYFIKYDLYDIVTVGQKNFMVGSNKPWFPYHDITTCTLNVLYIPWVLRIDSFKQVHE